MLTCVTTLSVKEKRFADVQEDRSGSVRKYYMEMKIEFVLNRAS